MQLRQVLLNNQSIFTLVPYELGTFKNVKVHIEIKDSNPARAPMYWYPKKAKPIIADMLEEMVEKGIIEPSTIWLIMSGCVG